MEQDSQENIIGKYSRGRGGGIKQTVIQIEFSTKPRTSTKYNISLF